MKNFKKELEELINKHSKENESDTPDYILADYINQCLESYNRVIRLRDRFYDFNPWAKLKINYKGCGQDETK